MPHVCPRCQRVNPGDAVYCYFDGVVLRQSLAGQLAPGLLPREFVFPSGRRCRSIDDLVQGCQYEWEDAREVLRTGAFARYFTTVGRMDLARSAREAESHPDPDIALHNFLEALPVRQVQGPRLDLKPRRIAVGKLRPGETRQLRLQIINQGKGFLQGKLTVAEGGDWLRVDGEPARPGDDDGHCALKTAKEQEVVLRVDTRGLPAPQSYSARLTVITNGGIAEVPVRLDLGTVPFGRAPFAGASTPREMAEKMRANPKAAVALFDSGEVQRWFQVNGWSYPVRGATARGVAAVQQFFEAMGLSKPPPVQLSETEVVCLCEPPEVVRRHVILGTTARKWVYALVDSDVPWLRVTTPNVAGAQQAVIAFEVDSSLLDGGRRYEGKLEIVANAGQRLTLRVSADVRQPHIPFTRRLFGSFLTFALLAMLYRVALALPADLYARILATEVAQPPPGSLERWTVPAVEEEGFLRQFVLATWWLGTLAGVWQLWKRRSRWSDVLTGAIAGTMAGAAAAVTAACLMTLVDTGPRLILKLAASDGGGGASPWVWTPVWVILAVVWWGLVGVAAAAALEAAGQRGRQLLTRFALPLTWLLQACGLRRAATLFALR